MTLVDGVHLMQTRYPCCDGDGRFTKSGLQDSYERSCPTCKRKWAIVVVNTLVEGTDMFREGTAVKKLVWTLVAGPPPVTDKDTLARARTGKRNRKR